MSWKTIYIYNYLYPGTTGVLVSKMVDKKHPLFRRFLLLRLYVLQKVNSAKTLFDTDISDLIIECFDRDKICQK